jgi:DNA-binding HxlR family transcriptional regulator
MANRQVAKPWYTDACGAAHALELLGERWALLVVRELMFGPRRFGELRAGLMGISANVLSQRLEGLEAAGVVVRRKLPSPTNAQVYELTPWGYETEPIFQALGRWGARSPSHDPSLPLSAASLMLSLRAMIDAKRAAGMQARIGLRLGNDRFVAHVQHSDIVVERGELEGLDATIAAEPTVLASVIYAGRSVTDAERRGALVVQGNRALAKRFMALFRLPPQVT